MTVTALDADQNVLTTKVLTDVPVTRNRITRCQGPLFGDGDYTIYQTAFGITVNTDLGRRGLLHILNGTAMKYYILMIAAVMMAACGNDDDLSGQTAGHSTRITFDIQGDFTLSTHDFTRALTADGKDMTDVWVWDYVGTDCQQTVHQTSGDADFGTPTMELGLGTHHLYFVASRGVTPTVDNDAKTINVGDSARHVLETLRADRHGWHQRWQSCGGVGSRGDETEGGIIGRHTDRCCKV